MNGELTDKQAAILDFVEACHDERQTSPSLDEIREHFGFKSLSTVRGHLRLIGKKGYLAREAGKARSLKVLRPDAPLQKESTLSVPLLGRIAAGVPIFALEHVRDTLALPRQLFRGRKLFAVQVEGDSMVGAGILDGDVAVIRAQPECDDGVIAAVILDEEATLKRVFRTGEGMTLRAENPAFPDRFISSETGGLSVRIAGVLAGVIRGGL